MREVSLLIANVGSNSQLAFIYDECSSLFDHEGVYSWWLEHDSSWRIYYIHDWNVFWRILLSWL